MKRIHRVPFCLMLFFLLAISCGGGSSAGQLHAKDPNAVSAAKPAAVAVEAKTAVANIRVILPKTIREKFISMAADEDTREHYRQIFLKLALMEGMGSGFVISGHTRDGRSLVVTNYHVVEMGDRPEVSFDGETMIAARVLVRDPDRDLAVLEVRGEIPGLKLNSTYAEMQDVFAVGYPAIQQGGSYQATRGNISNRCVHEREMSGSASKTGNNCWIQHTAAIDPGSSGGPLITTTHEVIGVNTGILQNRRDVFLAVPAEAIDEAVQKAELIREKRKDAGWMRDKLRSTCHGFIGELASGDPGVSALVSTLSNELVAEDGIIAYDAAIGQGHTELFQAFQNEPLKTLRIAIILFLIDAYEEGLGANERCEQFNPNDDVLNEGGNVRITTSLQGGRRMELIWHFEGDAWRLRNFSKR